MNSSKGLSNKNRHPGWDDFGALLLFCCGCLASLLRCPASAFVDGAPRHLPTAATRSPPSSRHRRRSAHSPVAVPEKIFGLTLFLDFFDRGHSLASLLPPPAAVGSLPKFSLASPVQICSRKQKNQPSRLG